MAYAMALFTYLLCLIGGLVATEQIFSAIILAVRRRGYGCRQPPRYPQKIHILGLDLYNILVKSQQSVRHLQLMRDLFNQYGKTF